MEVVKPGVVLESSKDLVVVPNQDKPFSDVSIWVLEKIDEVSRFLGLSFQGVKKQA